MTRSFTAQMRDIVERKKRDLELTFRAAVQDVGEEMTKRAAGTTDGGVLKEGYVPVVTGELINSHQISVNGGVIIDGAPDYATAVAGLEIGDTVRGVFTAPHARAKEYGSRIPASIDDTDDSTGDVDVPGWFFVLGAVQQWPELFSKRAKEFWV